VITAQDILDLLPIVADRGWKVGCNNTIRDRNERCPICSLLNETHRFPFKVMGITAWDSAGLPDVSAAIQIMIAANNSGHPLRPALMRALGMKP
jgi:hypothetical protein